MEGKKKCLGCLGPLVTVEEGLGRRCMNVVVEKLHGGYVDRAEAGIDVFSLGQILLGCSTD